VNCDLQDRPDFTEVLSVLEGRSAVQSVHQLKPKSQVIFTVNTLDLIVCVSVTTMDVICLGEGRTDWTTDASDCCSWPQMCTNMVNAFHNYKTAEERTCPPCYSTMG